MPEFPKSKIDELIRESAGGLRVSEDAVDAMALLLESLALEISRQAIAYAQAAKRKSVTAADIRKAAKDLWG
jgi:histone H3/H4